MKNEKISVTVGCATVTCVHYAPKYKSIYKEDYSIHISQDKPLVPEEGVPANAQGCNMILDNIDKVAKEQKDDFIRAAMHFFKYDSKNGVFYSGRDE